MANELKTFYSSGSQVVKEYSGEPKKSIGGIITATEVPSSDRNLFGTISLKQLSEGGTEYRCIFLKNSASGGGADITNLKVYTDVPVIATVTDPDDLIPAPVSGDKWIVPPSAEGDWLVPDTEDNTINTVEGKKATYNGATWDFAFAPFGAYEYGFIAPTDIIISPTETLLLSFVPKIENVFEAPAGITFTPADTINNILTIGTGELNEGVKLGMWIKRTVAPFAIQRFDLDIDEGGIVVPEAIPIEFTYDTP